MILTSRTLLAGAIALAFFTPVVNSKWMKGSDITIQCPADCHVTIRRDGMRTGGDWVTIPQVESGVSGNWVPVPFTNQVSAPGMGMRAISVHFLNDSGGER